VQIFGSFAEIQRLFVEISGSFAEIQGSFEEIQDCFAEMDMLSRCLPLALV